MSNLLGSSGLPVRRQWPMEHTLPLRCRCGQVRGTLSSVSAKSVNRVVCYCDDCQAFLQHLGRTDLMDADGGTDIVQLAPARVRLDQGTEHIAAVRLTPKGLYRWHSTCCSTPLGNTVGPAIPFVGIVAQAIGDGTAPAAEALGPPTGAVFGQFAKGAPPPGSTGMPFGLILRTLRKLLGWRLRGLTWPHPFFSRESKEPLYPVRVLTRAERAALSPASPPGHPA